MKTYVVTARPSKDGNAIVVLGGTPQMHQDRQHLSDHSSN